MALDVTKIQNKFLQAHLQYVEETEAPKIFHIWAAIGCISACMQRHLYLETGIGNVFGNQYIILVGPPATKKGTAIKAAAHPMIEAADIRVAPDDTGGQRQGLMSAMLEDEEIEIEMDAAEAMDINAILDQPINLRGINRHCLFARALEFGSLMGRNNADLANFLIQVWDGEDYKYQLRNSKEKLTDPLMTILGATTPSSLSTMLPQEAIGQGLMSRFVLVYAAYREKRVPPSKMKFDREVEPYLQSVYINVANNMYGGMTMSDSAIVALDLLYTKDMKIEDTRFIFYTERRQMHLLKLSMALAVAQNNMHIDESDVLEADLILTVTEEKMPEALGEYGLSPVAVARQKMLEYIRYANEPIPESLLWAVMRRDMKAIDFTNSLSALVNANKIVVTSSVGTRYYAYKDEVTRAIEVMDDDAIGVLLADGKKDIDKKLIN